MKSLRNACLMGRNNIIRVISRAFSSGIRSDVTSFTTRSGPSAVRSSIAILQLDGKGAVLVENVKILRASVHKPLEAFQDETFRSLYAALTVLALSLLP